jgi:hypothetical protein
MAFTKAVLAAGAALFALQTAMAQVAPSDNHTNAQLKKAIRAD